MISDEEGKDDNDNDDIDNCEDDVTVNAMPIALVRYILKFNLKQYHHVEALGYKL